MTIIAILLAIALCHFIRELGKCRKNQWLKSWINFSNDAFSRLPGWQGILGFLLITGVPLLLLLLINQVLFTVLGPSMMWHNARVVVEELATGNRTTVADGATFGRYVPTGHIIYTNAMPQQVFIVAFVALFALTAVMHAWGKRQSWQLQTL